MSGWIEKELPASFDRDLMHRGFPEAALPAIRGVANIYWHLREDRLERRSPRQIREDLEAIESLVGKLKAKLWSAPHGAMEALITTAHLRRVPDAIDKAQSALDVLDRLIGDTWQRIEPQPGMPGSRRTWPAVEIAKLLMEAGQEPTTKPSGVYVQTLGIFFKAVEEKGRAGRDEPDPREIAKTALAQMKNLPNTA